MIRKLMIAAIIAETLIALAIIALLVGVIFIGFDIANKESERLPEERSGVYRL